MDDKRLRALLTSELDLDVLLRRLLDVARDLTGARYAAIGVLDERRERLERFLTAGIDEAGREAIGAPPHGRGLLGLLITEPRPVRTRRLAEHPDSYGFPAAHPAMDTFLGVPILVRGEAWGNLYLTEKAGGDFGDADEEVAVVLAEWAAIAIENARLYRSVSERRDALQRVNHRLETTIDVSRALAGLTDPGAVLDLVVERTRSLLGARIAELAVRDGEDLLVAAAAGEGAEELRGRRLPGQDSLAGMALRIGAARHVRPVPPGTFAHDVLGATDAVIAPMLFRGQAIGVLVTLDRAGPGNFGEDDARLLESLAAGAATAVATAQEAHNEALRSSIRASESERARWARELHDQTLQDLAALRLLLATARNSGDAAALRTAVDQAVELLGTGVDDLRALINDLRPAALDELGLAAALGTLAERFERLSGVHVDLRTDLRHEHGRRADRHDAEVELTVYRLVQEALTNVGKHAKAREVRVRVGDDTDGVAVEVRDDGRGFRSPGHSAGGVGLIGMRERLAVVGGTLAITTEPGAGTTLRARIPVAPTPG
jgi:signal transduction histidine kinase